MHAFEIEEDLAELARSNLEPFENVSIIHGDATKLELPAADLIYVNAGVVAPPASWLKALRPGGRMIFPWRPTQDVGLAMLVQRTEQGYVARPLMRALFIPCVGASNGDVTIMPPTIRGARAVRSIWLTADRAPDDTAVAVYLEVWFSTASIP